MGNIMNCGFDLNDYFWYGMSQRTFSILIQKLKNPNKSWKQHFKKFIPLYVCQKRSLHFYSRSYCLKWAIRNCNLSLVKFFVGKNKIPKSDYLIEAIQYTSLCQNDILKFIYKLTDQHVLPYCIDACIKYNNCYMLNKIKSTMHKQKPIDRFHYQVLIAELANKNVKIAKNIIAGSLPKFINIDQYDDDDQYDVDIEFLEHLSHKALAIETIHKYIDNHISELSLDTIRLIKEALLSTNDVLSLDHYMRKGLWGNISKNIIIGTRNSQLIKSYLNEGLFSTDGDHSRIMDHIINTKDIDLITQFYNEKTRESLTHNKDSRIRLTLSVYNMKSIAIFDILVDSIKMKFFFSLLSTSNFVMHNFDYEYFVYFLTRFGTTYVNVKDSHVWFCDDYLFMNELKLEFYKTCGFLCLQTDNFENHFSEQVVKLGCRSINKIEYHFLEKKLVIPDSYWFHYIAYHYKINPIIRDLTYKKLAIKLDKYSVRFYQNDVYPKNNYLTIINNFVINNADANYSTILKKAKHKTSDLLSAYELLPRNSKDKLVMWRKKKYFKLLTKNTTYIVDHNKEWHIPFNVDALYVSGFNHKDYWTIRKKIAQTISKDVHHLVFTQL